MIITWHFSSPTMLKYMVRYAWYIWTYRDGMVIEEILLWLVWEVRPRSMVYTVQFSPNDRTRGSRHRHCNDVCDQLLVVRNVTPHSDWSRLNTCLLFSHRFNFKILVLSEKHYKFLKKFMHISCILSIKFILD